MTNTENFEAGKTYVHVDGYVEMTCISVDGEVSVLVDDNGDFYNRRQINRDMYTEISK